MVARNKPFSTLLQCLFLFVFVVVVTRNIVHDKKKLLIKRKLDINKIN